MSVFSVGTCRGPATPRIRAAAPGGCGRGRPSVTRAARRRRRAVPGLQRSACYSSWGRQRWRASSGSIDALFREHSGRAGVFTAARASPCVLASTRQASRVWAAPARDPSSSSRGPRACTTQSRELQKNSHWAQNGRPQNRLNSPGYSHPRQRITPERPSRSLSHHQLLTTPRFCSESPQSPATRGVPRQNALFAAREGAIPRGGRPGEGVR